VFVTEASGLAASGRETRPEEMRGEGLGQSALLAYGFRRNCFMGSLLKVISLARSERTLMEQL
jgi:hypothetical protein